jgi:hypothetical protein
MKKMRRGNFFCQDTDDDRIMQKIKNELGQGDWKIEISRSGSMVNWVAEMETPIEGPQ